MHYLRFWRTTFTEGEIICSVVLLDCGFTKWNPLLLVVPPSFLCMRVGKSVEGGVVQLGIPRDTRFRGFVPGSGLVMLLLFYSSVANHCSKLPLKEVTSCCVGEVCFGRFFQALIIVEMGLGSGLLLSFALDVAIW